MDSAIRIRHLGSDTRLFGSVRDSIARSARKFAYFSEHLHHLKSNLVRSQRFSSREARKKFVIWALLVRIHLLLPLLLHSRLLRKGPPIRFSALPQNPRRRGPGAPPCIRPCQEAFARLVCLSVLSLHRAVCTVRLP